MKNSSRITIANAWICQVEKSGIYPLFGDVQICDGKIEKIRPKDFNYFIQNPQRVNPNSFNASGRVLTIPLVNFHEHFYSRLAKGLPISGPMNNFQNILHNLWWKLDRSLDLKMIQASARMGALESIRNGVTYVFDHHASPNAVEGSLSTISEVLFEYGMRGVLCFETSDRNGAEITSKALEENTAFFENKLSDDLKAALGLHASFTLSDDTLAEAAEILRKYDLGIHIHLCEDLCDRDLSYEFAEEYPVQRLVSNNLLNVKSILSHGIHLTAEDYNLIAEGGSAIAYNPDSNLNNSVGIPQIRMIPENIPILIGTDGMHANPGRSLKQFFLLGRHQGNQFDESFHWIKKIFFDQLTFVRRYFPDFPSLLERDRADMILWDYIPPTPFNMDNFWGHYIYGVLEYPVHSVIHRGKFLMKNFEILVADENQVGVEIFKQGERLVDKLYSELSVKES